ncbi:MAG TPA: MlaD family protein [Agriterribacter sp.]|nr:MlaD family protein [Agriterribacter sp.]
MAKKSFSNLKLGVFVLAGLAFLILLLYMIGKNRNLFGATFMVKVHFRNVQGLTPGNNVRYAGIQVGTVKKVRILEDGRVEVELLIENTMKQYIRKNARANIATDGLMGNKVINIVPAAGDAGRIAPGDTLATQASPDLDNMVNTLSGTNNDLAVIAAELKSTLLRINSSTAVWALLNDNSLPQNLSASMANIRSASATANTMVNELNELTLDVKSGKGSLGAILTDTSFAENLNEAIVQIREVAARADTLVKELSRVTNAIGHDINDGKGAVNALLKDSAIVSAIHVSLSNIQKSTQNFNEVMEGMKHSFLVRGYFKKLEKKQAKEAAQQSKTP